MLERRRSVEVRLRRDEGLRIGSGRIAWLADVTLDAHCRFGLVPM